MNYLGNLYFCRRNFRFWVMFLLGNTIFSDKFMIVVRLFWVCCIIRLLVKETSDYISSCD